MELVFPTAFLLSRQVAVDRFRKSPSLGPHQGRHSSDHRCHAKAPTSWRRRAADWRKSSGPLRSAAEYVGAMTLTVRRPGYTFSDQIPRHWYGGSPFWTHFHNAFTLIVPEGERYLIRVLGKAAGRIDGEIEPVVR